MEYSAAVVRNFEAPRRVSELPADAPGWLVGEAEDRTQNVWVRFQLRLHEGVVHSARFQVFGCPHTIAAASLAADWLEGRAVEAARQLDLKELCAPLEVPAEKRGKLLRIEDAIAACFAGNAL
jgi:NifU-like protein involved in Fe-S cluster formation